VGVEDKRSVDGEVGNEDFRSEVSVVMKALLNVSYYKGVSSNAAKSVGGAEIRATCAHPVDYIGVFTLKEYSNI